MMNISFCRTTFLWFALLMGFTLLVLPLPPIVAASVAKRDTNTPFLILKVNDVALQKLLNSHGHSGVDDRGTLYEFGKGPGLRGEFAIGAHTNIENAKRLWQAVKTPAEAKPVTITKIGDEAQAWRIVGETKTKEEVYRVALRRANVVVQFEWRGLLTEVTTFALKLDSALENDMTLAPRGVQVSIPETEAIAPALAAARSPFPVLYRSMSAPLTLVSQAIDEFSGKTPVAVALEGPQLNAKTGRRTCAFETTGTHRLTVSFVTAESVVFQKSLRVRILEAQQWKALSDVKAWILPEKTVYFSSGAKTKWDAVPEKEREQIRLEHDFLTPFLPQPTGDDEWWPLRAWNEMVGTLRTEWLPPHELVQAFVNNTRVTQDKVAYAAYIRNNCRIVVMSEIGKQSWIYVEQTWPLPPQIKAVAIADVLLPDLAQPPDKPRKDVDGETIYPHIGLMSRVFWRGRRLTSTGNAEPVRLLAIYIERPTQINLNFPSYF